MGRRQTCRPPMRTRSGMVRSSTAVPSARNSGLERTWKSTAPPLLLFWSTHVMASAVLTGTVLFSTMIFIPLYSAVPSPEFPLIDRAAPSQYVKSDPALQVSTAVSAGVCMEDPAAVWWKRNRTCCAALAESVFFGRCVDGNEHDGRIPHSTGDICGEEKVLAAHRLHNLQSQASELTYTARKKKKDRA
jgi:hypothetical protein